MTLDPRHVVRDVAALRAIYGVPAEVSVIKETRGIGPAYRAWIAASPFAVLATAGPDGLDASPRGDAPGFVHVEDERTLWLPDRRGNNRIDSLTNIVRDPRVALLFFLPGLGETLRVNGRATISLDPALIARFAVGDKLPRSVLVIDVEAVFFQCSRAIVRSGLWQAEKHVAPGTIPSAGQVLAEISENRLGGEKYDEELPARVCSTLY